MTKQNNTESPWTETAPDRLVPEAEVPDRASELEARASSWLDANATFFDIYDWDGMKEKYWKKKSFNEAGIYLINALNHGDVDQTPNLEKQILERVNDQRFAELILRHQTDFHHFAYPALFAAYVDELDEEITTAMEYVAERGDFWSSERLPYRFLEFCYLARIIGVDYEHDEATLIEHSLLHNQPNVVKANYLDAYCLTHDVMFTNYDKLFYNKYTSSHGDGSIDVSDRYDIRGVLSGLILRYMAEDNLDITLELLLSGVLLRQISRELVRLVLSWALEKIESTGYIPGPPEESMYLVSSPKLMGVKGTTPWDYEYENEQEAIWAKSYHTNMVAGMTARVLKANWDKLDNRSMDLNPEDKRFREVSIGLGHVLKSLAHYDIQNGSEQLLELATSPVLREFPFVYQEAVNFLNDQQTPDGEFGYWTDEEILYTNQGHSQQSFRSDLVEPASEICQRALDALEQSNEK